MDIYKEWKDKFDNPLKTDLKFTKQFVEKALAFLLNDSITLQEEKRLHDLKTLSFGNYLDNNVEKIRYLSIANKKT